MTNAKKLTKIDKSVQFTPLTGSSTIASYARTGKNLALKFKNGGTYLYNNIDDATVKAFTESTSKGKFFATNIRNKFTSEQAE
jgi:hypothetical protein